MEGHIANERHNDLDLTDSGDNHGASYGGNDLFETHLNLQRHLNGAGADTEKM